MALVVPGLWRRVEHDTALAEGWYIDTAAPASASPSMRGEITEVRIRSADTTRWRTDDDCAAHVKRMAVLGSRFHAAALAAVAKTDGRRRVRARHGAAMKHGCTRHPDRKFFTKTGWLTPYALLCGYTQKYEEGGLTCTLDRVSSGSYRVTVYDPRGDRPGQRWPWQSHHQHLTVARHWFRRAPLDVALGISPEARGL